MKDEESGMKDEGGKIGTACRESDFITHPCVFILS